MRGFSLFEIIIALAVLGTGIAGSTALINRTISAGSAVRNQLIAANLAQEAMEVVHNIRHTNWVEGAAWDDGLIDGNSCVEFNSAALVSAGSCGNLSIEARRMYVVDNGVDVNYTHNSAATPTIFYRHINITSGVDINIPFKLVRSTVLWGNNSIDVEERLYNWK